MPCLRYRIGQLQDCSFLFSMLVRLKTVRGTSLSNLRNPFFFRGCDSLLGMHEAASSL